MATPINLPYAITGIPAEPGKNGEVPLRLECNDWTKSQEQVHIDQKNLFNLALRFYVDMDPLDRDSFWQTAGIHGMPYMPWNESTLPQSVPVLGYCTHNSSLFPSWHRPYVVLFEQRIYEIMVNEIIPNQMPSDDKTQDSLKTAAKAWRLPYWDWAANNEVPLLAQDQEIEVFTKFGTAKIKNALYQYNLPQGKTFGTMGPASNQTYTLVSADGVPASTVDNGQVAKNIRNHEWYSTTEDDPTLRESVYRLLTYDVPYEVFATTNMDPSDVEPLGYLNCEYIHNNVHNWVGGAAGQMGDVPVAAYDPIFFLHHCNIDRLYAIWQTLYPQKWFRATKVLKDNGTWSIPTDNPDTQCTQLAPFRPNNSGTYYTPDTVREWMQFGYSYPELQPWKYKTTEDYLLSINTDIAKLYRATADHISDSYEIGTDKDIVHYDHVINIRYGKALYIRSRPPHTQPLQT
ncbi:putative tyrosinase precursor protein [Eutypa lata UCREL1]|uniref:tyrosinase n=1 Tax=Eutypa lata (strain UCR-EL1) TaxID=1287681 RepID=M7TED0_EUTLA|nr:putative tyrosinase precursor protein [Eutypa lata UCREL1]